MIIMDYEKKYKEALARMKSWARGGHPECFDTAQKAAEFIFPELKESEEERTKRMLDVISYKMSQHQPDIFTEEENEWFGDWIEKQTKQNSTNKVEPEYKVGTWLKKCKRKFRLRRFSF